MSLVGYSAENQPQQVGRRGPNRSVDDRATTSELFHPLNDRFHFTVDVAASKENTKLPRYFTIEQDGLAQSWAGERVWCNPPFSDIRPWVEKAWGSTAELVVMIVPANRCEQPWWQDLVERFRDRTGTRLTTEFLPGRPRFIAPGKSTVGPNERPPFGCVLLVWRLGQ